MNDALDGSSLTPSQRLHREQAYRELERRYDSLTKEIAALDVDISRTQEEYRKQPLEEMRADKAAERDRTAEDMNELEAQLSSDAAQPDQLDGAPVQASAPAASPLSQTAATTTAPEPATSAANAETRRGGWFSRLPAAGKAAAITGVVAVIVAVIFVVARQGAVEDVPPTTAVVALQTHYGSYVTAWNDEGDRDWRLWGWINHPEPDAWEWFALECLADGKAAFRTYHDKYVTAMGADKEWVLRADADKIQAWEMFTLLDARTKKPLPCQDVITLIQRAKDQQVEVSLAIKTAHPRRYVTARDGTGDGDWRIWADETESLRDEQKFTVITQ